MFGFPFRRFDKIIPYEMTQAVIFASTLHDQYMNRILIIFGIFLTLPAFAQKSVRTRVQSGLDAAFAYKKDNYVPSLTYFQLLNIGNRNLLSVGWTARLAKFHGDNLNFYTAPARLTRGATGFEALGPALKLANIDTVRFDYVTNTSVNFGLRAEVHLGPVDLGGSADILGLAFGKTRIGRVISSAGTFRKNGTSTDSIAVRFTGEQRFQRMRPTGIDLRLLGDNDYGNLSTEIYARVHINPRLAIKGGYQWQTAEMYFRDISPADGNKRYRHRVGMPFVAVTFPFFN